ncbi:MAG: Cna domain protein, partial [Bryobacterales bacterium]|nr:Cna domain protein [Bryobacterales bacterium]
MLSAPVVLFGQANYGTIVGTVTDPHNSSIPKATIQVMAEGQGQQYRTSTNESGNYIIPQLRPGSYQIKIQADGFQTFVRTGIPVAADQATRVDEKLNLGETGQQITVDNAPPALMTDRAEVSATLDSKQVTELPIASRNLTAAEVLFPGSLRATGQVSGSENSQGGIQYYNNGLDSASTNYLLDGLDNNDTVLGLIVINPPVESVQEFKYTSANFDAEFARAGGAVIQVATKSGTNQLHGSLFEFLQNSAMNARNPFTEPRGPAPVRWNQFGGSVGGPIIKNKLFFFGDYQGTRQRNGASLLTTVPTAAIRAGDLGAFGIPIYDPSSGDANGNGRHLFTGGVIPQSQISAPAQKLLAMMPLPNTGPAGALNNNYNATGSQAIDSGQYDVKADHYVTDRLRYFARYSLANYNTTAPAAFGTQAGGPSLSGLGFAGLADVRNQSIVGSVSDTLTPSLIADLRVGYSRYRVNVNSPDTSTAGAAAGIPGVNIAGRPDTAGLPSFLLSGNGGFSMGFGSGVNGCNCPLQEREAVIEIANNWDKIAGNHDFRWGADIINRRTRRIASDSTRNGQFNFTPATTGAAGINGSGLSIASFLLGDPSQFTRQSDTKTDAEDAQTQMGYFFQDVWRVTPKLTLNLGIRWDTWFPNVSVNPGEGGRYEVSTNTYYVAGVGGNSGSAGVRTQWHNISPRIGIAWNIRPKTVLRAGFGRSYFEVPFGYLFGMTAAEYPTTVVQTITPGSLYTPIFNLSSGPPSIVFPTVPANGQLPLPNGISTDYHSADSRYPYADVWNASVQRELPGNVVFTASYVGNVGKHQRGVRPLNQAIPGPGSLNSRRPLYNQFGLSQPISERSTGGNTNYNALELKAEKRLSHGLSFFGSYTFAKAIDDSFGLMLNDRLNRGVAAFNRTHVFTLGHTLELPFGPGKQVLGNVHGFAGQLIGGWEFTGISLYQSGLPFSPSLSNNSSLNADISLRPDVVPGA